MGGCLLVAVCQLGQFAVSEHTAFAKGGVGCDQDIVVVAILEDVGFRSGQVVLDLVGTDGRLGGLGRFFQEVYGEVADADASGFARIENVVHCPEGFREGNSGVGPVDEEEVEVVGAEVAQGFFAVFQNAVEMEVGVPRLWR